MVADELASSVVRSLSNYLTRKGKAGPSAYDARLENLLGLVEVKFSEPFTEEIICRFKDNPTGVVEVNTLALHLSHEIGRDAEFAQQLRSAIGGQLGNSTGRRNRIVGIAAVLVVAAIVSGFLLWRSPTSDAPVPPVAAVTSSVAITTTDVATTTTTADTSSTTAPSTPSGSASPGIPGDGSSLSKGEPVLLTELPRPNDEWEFDHGDHDVQFTQYNNSLWDSLVTCNSSGRSSEQQFRLKNFSSIEVKAVGTDSTSDPELIVRFEIFANNNDVDPVAAAVVNPGESKAVTADLPADVFAVTLRASLERVDATKCKRATAVWGSPYVVAAGS